MATYGYVKPYCPVSSGLKVVFIGTSLVRGAVHEPGNPYSVNGFAYRGGPRPTAFAALTEVDPTADFIGHVLNSSETPEVTTAGTAHSGINATSGHNWYASYWDTTKAAWTGAHVFCIQVGANDADSAAAATDFCRLMDKAAVDFPQAVVLFATEITPEAGGLDDQAAQVRVEVASRKAIGMNVELVDLHEQAGLVTGDWSDGLHLTDRGYAKVGAIYGRHLRRLLGR